ncbi:MAG: UbiA family prenyltransferase [Halorhodospira sp.]
MRPKARKANSGHNSRPLVIDLDGTLLDTDLLFECAFAYLRLNPLGVLTLLIWLFRGKAHLKARLAEAVDLDLENLPFNPALLQHLEAERRQGRSLWLATASDHLLAECIAQQLGVFDGVLATRDGDNLSGHRKREVLQEQFGEGGFDYAGNERRDLPVWAIAAKAWAVNPSRSVERRARRLGNLDAVIRTQPGYLGALARSLRLHQWAKNLLLFVPLATSHQIVEPQLVFQAVTGFLAFGLCASAVYILNDLMDLRDDRQHPSKRNRPLARGALPIQHALILAPGLLLAALALSILLLPTVFVVALGVYLFLTTLYSLWLKRLVIIDVITLAMLYTLRIIAGAAACGLALTFWILAFSVFIFLSLAMVKRYAELLEARQGDSSTQSPGRGYNPDDLQVISSLGGAAGYLSVLVLALYIQDPAAEVLYTRPEYIWLACPILLFWVSRTWLLTHRGQMPEDPVLFALKDRVSQGTGLVFLAVFIAAL